LEQIKGYAPENIKMVLVGNNCDLANERKVSIEEAEEFAKKNNMKFFEASPKEGTNVMNYFFVWQMKFIKRKIKWKISEKNFDFGKRY